MAVSGVFFGQFDKMPLLSMPSQMNSRAADTAPAKATAPETTAPEAAQAGPVSEPVSASATLADPAPTPAPTPISPQMPPQSVADPAADHAYAADALALPDKAGSGAALPPLIAQSGVAVLLLVALALVRRRFQKSKVSRSSSGDGEVWARLDRMVAAERARS